MVPDDYGDFFLAAAGASAALVGLLFVAVSLSTEELRGAQASVLAQVRASTALTSLGTPLIIALVGLIPSTGLGTAAAVVGVGGLVGTARRVRRLLGAGDLGRRRLTVLPSLATATAVAVVQLAWGLVLISHAGDKGALDAIAGSIVVSLIVGIDRAWELVGAAPGGVLDRITALIPRPKVED